MPELPPAITSDFLDQSSGLLARLDGDLAELRRTPGAGAVAERMLGAMTAVRAGAGFLVMREVEAIALRGEHALACIRDDGAAVGCGELDELAAALELLRGQLARLRGGERSGGGGREHGPSMVADDGKASEPERVKSAGIGRAPLRLEASKAALVEFMVEDLRETIDVAEQASERLASPETEDAGAAELLRIGTDLTRIGWFFELADLADLGGALAYIGAGGARMDSARLAQVMPRVRGLIELLREQADALAYSTIIRRPIGGVCAALGSLGRGEELPTEQLLPEGCSTDRALEIDGVMAPTNPALRDESESTAAVAAIADAPLAVDIGEHAAGPMRESFEVACDSPGDDALSEAAVVARALDDAARADAERMESCIALAAEGGSDGACPARDARAGLDGALGRIGDLVVQTNRLLATPLEGAAGSEGAPGVGRASDIVEDLARAVGGVREAVLDARRERVRSLLREWAGAVQDGARRAGGAIRTEVSGDEVEMDMGVIERLRAPIVALCVALGESGSGHDGLVTISARGDGADGRTEFRLALAFSPGGCEGTAWAAARAAVESMHGTIELGGGPGVDGEVRINVPNSLVFVHCMVVRVGEGFAAIPMSAVEEVVRPLPDQIAASGPTRVVVLRQGAAVLLDGRAICAGESRCADAAPYAVVVRYGEKLVALGCTRAIGAQEIVVRPMDPRAIGPAPVRGVGACADGSPAFIIDVPRLIAMAEEQPAQRSIAA